jgi:hypothetical protein
VRHLAQPFHSAPAHAWRVPPVVVRQLALGRTAMAWWMRKPVAVKQGRALSRAVPRCQPKMPSSTCLHHHDDYKHLCQSS